VLIRVARLFEALLDALIAGSKMIPVAPLLLSIDCRTLFRLAPGRSRTIHESERRGESCAETGATTSRRRRMVRRVGSRESIVESLESGLEEVADERKSKNRKCKVGFSRE
jgi:hypothetical protein